MQVKIGSDRRGELAKPKLCCRSNSSKVVEEMTYMGMTINEITTTSSQAMFLLVWFATIKMAAAVFIDPALIEAMGLEPPSNPNHELMAEGGIPSTMALELTEGMTAVGMPSYFYNNNYWTQQFQQQLQQHLMQLAQHGQVTMPQHQLQQYANLGFHSAQTVPQPQSSLGLRFKSTPNPQQQQQQQQHSITQSNALLPQNMWITNNSIKTITRPWF
ncbi:hypothetical protein RRG08_018930 [Elysia crispata]|uniref:Uncharacterized protein n=1 Tax=Elysia crispata TaxID=231223 RepID=A0AAE1A6E5_9GAST|nr:hypothetical protein RRG08_018930 [Elysia crispata]